MVAVDSFKGSIGAADAAATIGRGWLSERPDDELLLRPMADGGEGTMAAFELAVPGSRRMVVGVRGPAGQQVASAWLLLPDGTGVVELASTSGIELLGERRLPFDADTYGFGEAIASALAHGVDRLLLGIGSSASTDGGVGLLTALGARFLGSDGTQVAPGLRGLTAIRTVDRAHLVHPPDGGVVVLSDVTNPLLGRHGAAAVFGPQKGIRPDDIAMADRALAHVVAVLPADPELPGAGAAGGSGFALLAWGARLVPGAPEVARLIGLEKAIGSADLVITGEGRFDSQSTQGKVPGFVAEVARAAGVPVALLAGRITQDADLTGFTDHCSLTDLAGSSESAMADPQQWLLRAAATLAARA